MIDQQLTFRCDGCGKEWKEVLECQATIAVTLGHALPPGWSLVRGRLICDEHQIIIKAEENS